MAEKGSEARWFRGSETAESGEVGLDVSETSGVVKWYDASKGYGFIVTDDGSVDILLHAADLRRNGYRTAHEGARILFEFASVGSKRRRVFRILSLDEQEVRERSAEARVDRDEETDLLNSSLSALASLERSNMIARETIEETREWRRRAAEQSAAIDAQLSEIDRSLAKLMGNG